jgi:hypothetical protein
VSRPGRSVQPSLLVPAGLLHLASWLAMLAHGRDWVGAWMNAVDEVAGSVVVVGPLLAGLTANVYAHRGRTSLPVLTVASAHPLRAWYAPAARFWGLAILNVVVLLGEAAVLVSAAGCPLSLSALVIVPVCCAVLACHVLLGMVIGLRLSPKLAGAVAGAVSFGGFLLAVAHLAPPAFVTGGVTGDLVGQQYRSSVVLTLALDAVLTVVALSAGTGWNTRWVQARAAAALVTIASAVLLGNGQVVDLDNRFVAVQAPFKCRGAAPSVCVPRDAPRSLADASRRFHRLAGPLRTAGVDLPDRWDFYWGQRVRPGSGVLSLDDGDVLRTRVADEEVISALATPARCAAFSSDLPVERAITVQLLLEHWIAVRNGRGFGDTRIPRSWFSSQASEAWVRSTYAKLRRCDVGGLRFPAHTR